MNYLLRNNHRPQRPLLPILIALFSLVFVFVAYTFSPSLIGGPFRYVAYPFWKARIWSGEMISKVIISFQSKENLSKEIETLRLKSRANESLVLLLEVYRKENEELKGKLGRELENERKIAAILASPPVSPYDTLVVDIGNSEGVKKGMKVVIDEVIVGKISEVSNQSSKVKLFTTPEETLEVVIGENRIQAEARGYGGGNFKIVLPKGILVNVGDPVLLPNSIPEVIGVVGYVSSDEVDSFQNIFVRVPVNYKESKFVEVIISPFNEIDLLEDL